MHSRRTRRAPRRGGFTLIEVLLVLAILGVIAAMVVPNLLGRQDEANIKAAKNSIRGIEQAADLYRLDHNGKYPQGGQDALLTLSQPETVGGRTKEPYLDKATNLDPWGQTFFYQYPSSHGLSKPDVWSAGPDGKNDQGSGDDVANWHDQL